ncbi:hypothetical protein NQ176_g946 [Zarea fungicola]|uniref:Uncharacterized protein n=1 Tax=Zarea fungicola TaxID=93591 RepID=A0ACC1NUT5_9HYPO|nr:hypothetical protein NQ176_g946 [Lecanicillium fungicola]
MHFKPLAAVKLASLSNSESKQNILQKIDSGLFSAAWWPTANFEAGLNLSRLVLWLFIWDDEIDAEGGHLAGDFQAAQDFRQTTINFVEHCLGLTNSYCPTPSNQILQFFKRIGDAVCHSYDEGKALLFSEIKFFIECSELEQSRRLSPDLPTIAEYQETRMGTSAVNITTFFNEYACNITLPVAVLEEPLMKIIWDKTNTIIWAVNDIVSLNKEVAQNTVDSMVPLLYTEFGSMKTALAMIVGLVEEAVESFDRAATALLGKYSDDGTIADKLTLYIDACRQNCTGNLYWSLRTARYDSIMKHETAAYRLGEAGWSHPSRVQGIGHA